ncbi:daunorubicin resistance protein DrrA family ABC transporter ATP-binding protein [Haloechinothrix halophila]|uniref:daunorubicin resistance protein DrrA family ABC transporter ATP-binding protein n=1 Tax=Haloechinothrix halophila TaxID=1069073 RepID=UPI0005536994|nr:daunorubicin resistance protein DrrA family ABC transporter ATP-binding protein [Haloechinothrix halophila]
MAVRSELRPGAVSSGSKESPAIQVADLAKRYGSIDAVRGVSFAVKKGELFAFLGPNGAGKTTTINMLCTLALPSSGGATVAGFDIAGQARQVRRHIGLVFQNYTLDPQLTAEENLRFHAVLYRIPRHEVSARMERVLNLVDLLDRKSSRVSTFSGGMIRRLEIARALLHMPRVLFLDEPTVGLDPQTRSRMWQDVLHMRKEDVTIFLTTHYLDEAENADRIAIMDHGEIVACDTPAALKAAVGADAVDLVTADDTVARDSLAQCGYDAHIIGGGVRVYVADGERSVSGLVAGSDVEIQQLRVHRPTLDDVFMHFTGRDIRAEGGGLSAQEQQARTVAAGRH